MLLCVKVASGLFLLNGENKKGWKQNRKKITYADKKGL